MKKLKVLLLALILIPLFASAKEIVLQNGLNGYNGCEDTWILRYAKEGLIMQEYMPDRIEVYADTCLS